LVCEADAAALVADAAQALALRGHTPRITAVNGPRLVRLAARMLVEFGVAGGTEPEDDDG
jgi:hypothetical protein